MLTTVIKLLLLCGLLALPIMGYADDATLTLEQAIELGLAHNPGLKAAKAQLGVAEAEVLTAKARPNPKLLSDNGLAEDTYRLGVEQTLELGGKRSKRIDVAKAQLSVTAYDLQRNELTLKADIRKAYAVAYYAQAKHHAYQDVFNTANILHEVAVKREMAGDIAQLDVLQAKIVMVTARNDEQTALSQVTEAMSQLNVLIGQPISHTVHLAAPPATLEKALQLEDLIARAIEQRPELHQAAQKIVVAEKQEELAGRNSIPDLSLAVGPDLVTSGGNNQLNVFAIATVELPVWNRQQGERAKAQAQQQQFAFEMDALDAQIKLEVTNAYYRWHTQFNRLLHYETELLPAAKAVLEKSQRSLEEGKATILIPLNAQKAYSNTILGYIDAQQAQQMAISDLERATGETL